MGQGHVAPERKGEFMKIRDVMTANPKLCTPDSTLKDVACMMRDNDTGFIPICDGDRITGVITDRDMVVRSLCQGVDTAKATVRDCMSMDICWIQQDQDIKDAIAVMEERKIRRMLVMDQQKKLVGVFSLGDLAEAKGIRGLAEEVLQRVSESPKTTSHPASRQ
jgi:CBS domain-containing protein